MSEEEVSVLAPQGSEVWKDPMSRALEMISEPSGEEAPKLIPFAEGEVSTLGDFGISLTERRQEALIDFQKITGLPALPMQDQFLEFERSVSQLLAIPLQLLPLPFKPESIIEAIPLPSDFIRTKEAKPKPAKPEVETLPSTKVEAKREVEEIAIQEPEPKALEL